MNRVILTCLSIFFIIGFGLYEVDAKEKRSIEQEADRILRNAGEYLKSADKFSFRAELEFDVVHLSGQMVKYSSSYKLFVRRPDRIRAEIQTDRGKRRFLYDGKTINILDMMENVYMSTNVPPEIDEAMDYVMEKYDVTVPIVDLIFSDPYAVLTENVHSGFYVGRQYVQGVKCHHLAFSQELIDWQIWIEDSVTPVPRKFVITYKQLEVSPQYISYLSNWDFNPRLLDLVFEFVPPANARKVDIITPVTQLPREGRK